MKKIFVFVLSLCAVAAVAQQVTPNLGLVVQTPPPMANNWSAIINYDLWKLDGNAQAKTIIGTTTSPSLPCSSTANNNIFWLGTNSSLWNCSNLTGSYAWRELSSGPSAAWGSITGTLSSQTDLQSALNAKAPYPSTGLAKSTGSAWGTPSYSDVAALWASGSCSGYLKNDGTCSTPSAATWGSITGTLSSQTDLQSALNAKWNVPTFSNVVALWASGVCSGYLKSDGTCDIPGGSGPLPSNAVFVFGPTSLNDDDHADTPSLSPAISISSYSAPVAGIVTITNTGTNNLHVGDWVNMRAATGWPTSGTLAAGTGLTQFQVLASGLSGTQAEINVGSLAVTACPSSCGSMYSAMNNLPQNVTNSPLMPATANANTVVLLPSDVTIRGMCNAWATVYHPYSAAVLGKPVYLIINNYNNDFLIGRTDTQIEDDYQCVFSAAHTDGDLVLVGTPTAVDFDQSLSVARYTTWFSVKKWLKEQTKTPANIANSNKYFDYIAPTGEVLNNGFNRNLIASNNGMGPAGSKLAANAIVTALVTGAGTLAPDAGTMYTCDIGQADTSFGNGLCIRLPVDSGRSFQIINAAGDRAPFVLNTGRGSLPDIATFGSPGPIRTVTEGNTGATNNFEPVTVIHDAAAGVFNSAVKEWLLYNAFTPNADVSKNNLIMTLSGESYSGTNAPSLAAGKSVDFGFSYNSASTLTLNHFFVHVNGDTLDSLHAATGGQVCIGVNTGEATGGQKGCPTALMFSVGATPGFTVDSSGNTVVASLKTSNITGVTQCLHADSAGNVTGAGSDCGTTSGGVTTTGTPASGNLAKFSGSNTITNGDLSGDVTTSGTLATTIAANAVTGAKMANNTVTATQLAAQYSKGSCTEAWGGSGTSFALTSGDDAASNNTCYNDSGVTRTIIAVKCRSDAASNTTTVNPSFGSAGTGTTILSGALTCGNSYAYSSSGTVSNASWTTGTGIDPVMGGTLTGTSIAMIVEYTY